MRAFTVVPRASIWASVFKKIEKQTFPRLPGGKEMDIPALKIIKQTLEYATELERIV